jgi:hypothetical protein
VTLPAEKGPLSAADFASAAQALGCEPAAIQAVAAIEGGPYGAFLPTGEPVILYERHLFHRFTSGRFDASTAPGLPEAVSLLSDPEAGGYGPESVQHGKLEAAVALDRPAALRATSWGLFQVLGDNAGACDLELQDFVNRACRSTADHLDLFCRFVRSDRHLWEALRAKDWPAFALHYNGKGFARDGYDARIRAAYERLA